MIALLDVTAFYARYAPVGGEAYAPELLLVSWPKNAIHAGISRSVPITQKGYPF